MLKLLRRSNNLLDCDWRSLVILDACRFDAFEQVNWLDGKLGKVWSVGSCTGEWVKNTFKKVYSNITYVSANPHIGYMLLPKICGFVPFHRIVEVFLDGWSEELQTVLPKEVNKACYGLEYETDRLVVHYMQPHIPYRKRLASRGWDQFREKLGLPSPTDDRVNTAYDLMSKGVVSGELGWFSYLDNIEFALEYVEKLLPLLPKPVVVSADHGDCFGEHGVYGHPEGKNFKELREVPYLEIK